jgi:hypothetical protein
LRRHVMYLRRDITVKKRLCQWLREGVRCAAQREVDGVAAPATSVRRRIDRGLQQQQQQQQQQQHLCLHCSEPPM